MGQIFDVGVIGVGVSGTFACYHLALNCPDLKVIAFDIGRPPAKRRSQMNGFLGLFPNSDGRIYPHDIDNVSDIIGIRKTNKAFKEFMDVLNFIPDVDLKLTKDKKISKNLEKRIKKAGYEIQLNNHYQLFPRDFHLLSKYMADKIEKGGNVSFSFDDEILSISIKDKIFILEGETGEYRCKKLLLSCGRWGWRFSGQLFSNFGLIEENDISRFGVRIEMPANNLKEFNKSHLTIKKANEFELGPFSWFGTVIPEDHDELAISSFRANENRWKSDKVSFQFICDVENTGEAYQKTDRLGQLSFLLTNDRVIKERVSSFLNKRGSLSELPEYDPVIAKLKKVGLILPEILEKAYYHAPTLVPLAPKINIGTNLETEVPGLYVAGESAGVIGLGAAAMMGLAVGKELAK
jgi:uncharacterized FAD-dependent dehydrogenase